MTTILYGPYNIYYNDKESYPILYYRIYIHGKFSLVLEYIPGPRTWSNILSWINPEEFFHPALPSTEFPAIFNFLFDPDPLQLRITLCFCSFNNSKWILVDCKIIRKYIFICHYHGEVRFEIIVVHFLDTVFQVLSM